MEKQNSVIDDLKKFWLAVAVLILCLLGLVAAAWLLYSANNTVKIDAAKAIFNAVLPLIGAWVGAILAYYFGAKHVENSEKIQTKALDLIGKQAEESQAVLQRVLKIIEGHQAQNRAGQ